MTAPAPFRRFPVPDFPNHHNIRILSHNGPESFFKGQPRLLIQLYLAHPLQAVLHRILHGYNADPFPVQHFQGRIEGGRFSAACGTGSENHAAFSGKAFPENCFLQGEHAQLILLYEIHLP